MKFAYFVLAFLLALLCVASCHLNIEKETVEVDLEEHYLSKIHTENDDFVVDVTHGNKLGPKEHPQYKLPHYYFRYHDESIAKGYTLIPMHMFEAYKEQGEYKVVHGSNIDMEHLWWDYSEVHEIEKFEHNHTLRLFNFNVTTSGVKRRFSHLQLETDVVKRVLHVNGKVEDEDLDKEHRKLEEQFSLGLRVHNYEWFKEKNEKDDDEDDWRYESDDQKTGDFLVFVYLIRPPTHKVNITKKGDEILIGDAFFHKNGHAHSEHGLPIITDIQYIHQGDYQGIWVIYKKFEGNLIHHSKVGLRHLSTGSSVVASLLMLTLMAVLLLL